MGPCELVCESKLVDRLTDLARRNGIDASMDENLIRINHAGRRYEIRIWPRFEKHCVYINNNVHDAQLQIRLSLIAFVSGGEPSVLVPFFPWIFKCPQGSCERWIRDCPPDKIHIDKKWGGVGTVELADGLITFGNFTAFFVTGIAFDFATADYCEFIALEPAPGFFGSFSPSRNEKQKRFVDLQTKVIVNLGGTRLAIPN